MTSDSALQRNVESLCKVLTEIEALESQVFTAANGLATALLQGRKLLACGNGGSAADASHLTTEFVSRFNRDRRPYPAISLSAHGGDLTAIGNDYCFDDVFARQVEAFGNQGDVLIVLTSSGQSENVRRALIAATRQRMLTIGLLGKNGGICAGLAEIELLVKNDSTARIQEAHILLLHTICELVEEHIQKQVEGR